MYSAAVTMSDPANWLLANYSWVHAVVCWRAKARWPHPGLGLKEASEIERPLILLTLEAKPRSICELPFPCLPCTRTQWLKVYLPVNGPPL